MKKHKINHLIILFLGFGYLWVFTSGCAFAAQGVKGDGNVVKQERTISPFNGIEVGGAFKVFLTQGDKESLVVEADENLLELIETEVRGNTLKISTKNNIRDSKALNIYITFQSLQELEVSGACHLTSESKLKLENLDLECSGASDVMLKLSSASMEIDCSGASQIQLFGMAESVEMDISGASRLEALEYEVRNCEANVSGASHAKIFVTGELSAEVSGAGSLKYKGEAVLRNHDVSGAGSLKKY